MEFYCIKNEINNLEWLKSANEITSYGLKKLKELKLALSICEVNRSTKIKINEPFEIEEIGEKYVVEINNFIDKDNLWDKEINFVKID